MHEMDDEHDNESQNDQAQDKPSDQNKPFDEEQLLELAKTEGLADALEEEQAAETSASVKLELSESEQSSLMASMETVLFMSDKPVSLPKLRSIIGNKAGNEIGQDENRVSEGAPNVPLPVYRQLMTRLREEFAREHRGIEIAEVSLGFQLRTKPHMASVLRKMVKTQPLKLSSATMEVLAIIAYKQPVTKDELDQVRGVDCGHVLRNLMEKRLVKIAGRSELPGKPMVYGTTHEFLELFNLKDLQALPSLHEVESMVAASEVGAEEKASEAMSEFGKMIASADKILFDDSQIDSELESLRSEIAAIPTSTSFIDEQKAKEKLDAKLAELATQGLTLDSEGNVIPIELASLQPEADHKPSSELEAQAAAAQQERHAAMIQEALDGSEQELDAAHRNEHNLES